jgi:predicted nucleotidyltransferase
MPNRWIDMPGKSSDFARTFFADKEKVFCELRRYAQHLRQTSPQVVKVGCFGSYTDDTYGPASDVDLLIILRNSEKSFVDRIPDFLPDALSVGCDCFPYTTADIERMKQDGMPWIHHVLNEIVWL